MNGLKAKRLRFQHYLRAAGSDEKVLQTGALIQASSGFFEPYCKTESTR